MYPTQGDGLSGASKHPLVRYCVDFRAPLCESYVHFAETVENYSIVIPEIINTEGDGVSLFTLAYGEHECSWGSIFYLQPYPKVLDVVIATEDLHYTLLLELNE